MDKFLTLLANGLSLGFVYALLALGFVVVFKATEVVNFAHAAFLMVGAWTVAVLRVQVGLPFVVALLGGVAASAVTALVVERVLVRKMWGRSVIAVGIMTIGVDIVLQTEIIRRIGVQVLTLGDPWQSATISVGPVTLPHSRLAAVVAALVLLGLFFGWFRWSLWGTAMRAAAEDQETTALMGVRLSRISRTAWLIAGGLAAVAGVFLTAFPTPGLDATTSAVALRAFPAAILGGLDSTGGAVAGGLLIGLAETFAGGYQGELLFLGRGFQGVMPYVVMVVVLLIRPTGLFGTKELSRV
jgi:branched-chain amino acid transport system permease protein